MGCVVVSAVAVRNVPGVRSIWHVPWTLMIPLETTGERMFECACHDGNYGLEAILRGTREQEKQST